MDISQLAFFDDDSSDKEIFSKEDIESLKEKIVPLCKESATLTLRMSYLDPDNTTAQMIGTYLYGNLTSRLHGVFGADNDSGLKAEWVNQRFVLNIELANGKTISLPVHRSRLDYVPAGAGALKRRLRATQYQCLLLNVSPPGLFIGLRYDEIKGLLEVFLGKLSWNGIKRQYSTKVLAVLYSRPVEKVDSGSLSDHEYEQVKTPEVKLKRSGE